MWHLDDDDKYGNDNKYLVFPDDVNVPKDAVNIQAGREVKPVENEKNAISGVYNQLWEARGKDAGTTNHLRPCTQGIPWSGRRTVPRRLRIHPQMPGLS